VDVPISLKNILPTDILRHRSELNVKLAVDFVAYSAEYDHRGSRAFWNLRGDDAIQKSVVCHVYKVTGHKGSIHALSSDAMIAFEHTEKVRLGTSTGASAMKISPTFLEFEGMSPFPRWVSYLAVCIHFNTFINVFIDFYLISTLSMLAMLCYAML
jgi:hypothetical protein